MMSEETRLSGGDLAARVRDARRARGWTQERLAEESGVKLRSISSFENGHSTPQPANLRKILRVLGLTDEGGDVLEFPTKMPREWPRDIEVFRDMLAAYLATVPEDERLTIIHDLTRQIFAAHRQQ
jgi:transcriptional regulator with XRE-family HTH domain